MAAAAGTNPLWTGLPKLVVVLLGGFTTNFVWCVFLNLKNGSGYEYLSDKLRSTGSEDARIPRLNNYLFSAIAGTTWYLQFFFYTMGETQMGRFGFASWTLHMASIIIFGTLWGIHFREWQGTSTRVRELIVLGIVLLVGSTIVIGVGTWMKVKGQAPVEQSEAVALLTFK